MLKQCPLCNNVQKSCCGKASCLDENGEKLVMIFPSVKSSIAGPFARHSFKLEMHKQPSDESEDLSESEMKESNLEHKWFAVVYPSKRKKILFVAKLLKRTLMDKDAPAEKFLMKCLMPKLDASNILEDTPRHQMRASSMSASSLLAHWRLSQRAQVVFWCQIMW